MANKLIQLKDGADNVFPLAQVEHLKVFSGYYTRASLYSQISANECAILVGVLTDSPASNSTGITIMCHNDDTNKYGCCINFADSSGVKYSSLQNAVWSAWS